MPRTEPLWSPSLDEVQRSPMMTFMHEASKRTGRSIATYEQLHDWSVTDREAFWKLVWQYCGIVGEPGVRIIEDGDRMPGASFFPDARLNFAENLLCRKGPSDALVFRGEDKVERRVSWDGLRAMVSQLQQVFLDEGLKAGDRVAAMMPNMPETIAAMLAAASLGAVWSSCSPDFGEQGVLDRFGQIEPVIFVTVAGVVIDAALGNLDREEPVFTSIFAGLVVLSMLVPSLAVTVRRIHDIGLSGWFILLGLIPTFGNLIILVFAMIPSQKRENRWGEVPDGIL